MKLPLRKANNKSTELSKVSNHTKKENKAIIIIVLSAIAAIAAFFFLVNIEKNILTNYEKKEVVVAFNDVPYGTVLNETNVKDYFTVEEREAITLPDASFTTLKELYGLSPIIQITGKTVPVKSMFSNVGEITEGIGDPVRLSFAAGVIDQAVSGSVRAGDFINLYTSVTDEFTKQQSYITKKEWQKVYVSEVRDSSGVVIENANATAQATMFSVIINKNDVKNFYANLNINDLKIAKVTELVNNGIFQYDEENYETKDEFIDLGEEPATNIQNETVANNSNEEAIEEASEPALEEITENAVVPVE